MMRTQLFSFLTIIVPLILPPSDGVAADRPRLYEAERIYPSGPIEMGEEFANMKDGKPYPSHGIELAVYKVKESDVFFLCQNVSRELTTNVLLYTGKQDKWFLLSEDEQTSVTCCGYSGYSDEFCPDSKFGGTTGDQPEILARFPGYIGIPLETIGSFDIKPSFYRRGPEGKMLVIQNRILITTERPPSGAAPENHYLAVMECPNVEYASSGGSRINWGRVGDMVGDINRRIVTFADRRNQIVSEDECVLFAALRPLQKPSELLPESFF